MNRRKGTIFVKIICIMVFCTVAFMGFCEAIAGDLSENLVRLHIIANSDRAEDQKIKLLVRDYIIKEETALSNENALTLPLAQKDREKLTEGVNNLLKELGAEYTCRMETGRFYFPTKVYDNITLPQGDYDAVRVVLGKGEGENWWCVMYPPLCFTESAKGKATEKLKDTVSSVTDAVIDNERIELEPALKAVELWQGFKKKIEIPNLRLTFGG